MRSLRNTFIACGVCLGLPVAVAGCSVKKFAINKLGDSLANSGTTFAADDDPELVGQALPFSLKLVEGLLAESPHHHGLLLTAASRFSRRLAIDPGDAVRAAEKVDLSLLYWTAAA